MCSRAFRRRAVHFLLLAALLYAGLYAASEWLVYANGLRNRFFAVKTSQLADFDYVILGASHAVPLDFADMNARLEEMTHSRILNLSTISSGVLVNRLLIDYFLAEHRTRTVVYILDSGVFFSSRWNEGRLNDPRLYARAPFDPHLAARLVWNPVTVWQGLNYAVGFSKINNADRFRLDVSDDEARKFDKVYIPSAQIDSLRFRNFYPDAADRDVFLRYLASFEDMLRALQQRGIDVVTVKPPVTDGWYDMQPDEAWSDEAFQHMLQLHQVPFYDFSLAVPEDALFYDADHLNRAGVVQFFETCLAPVMLAQAVS